MRLKDLGGVREVRPSHFQLNGGRMFMRLFLTVICLFGAMEIMAKHIAYIGTYAKPDGGVHVLEIDGETGAFREVRVVTGIADPTYLCMNKAKTNAALW